MTERDRVEIQRDVVAAYGEVVDIPAVILADLDVQALPAKPRACVQDAGMVQGSRGFGRYSAAERYSTALTIAAVHVKALGKNAEVELFVHACKIA